MDPTGNVLGAFPGVRDQKLSNNDLFYGAFPKEMVMNPLNAVRSVVFSVFTISVGITLLYVSSFPKLSHPFRSSAKFGINKRHTK
jgi:hypothetical protein